MLLADLPEAERLSSWRLARPSGSLSGGGRGSVDLLASLSTTRWAAAPLGLLPETVLESAYGFVARRRGGLGRLVPDGPAPRRFP